MAAFADRHYPDLIHGKELDEYLSKGWYRMGQSIFTTHFLCFEETIYPAIWVRVDLARHSLSKSQRKLMRRNSDRFQTCVVPLTLTDEKEALYQRYREQFDGYIAPTLRDSLFDGGWINVYQTLETQIYDGDKLVGISFFDIGNSTSASILGIYDPDYQSYSLGYFTMLLEMEYCKQQHFNYYYPGYVVPGYPRFDYKLRLGSIEYLRLHAYQWLDYETYEEDQHDPLVVMHGKLTALYRQISGKGVSVKMMQYPLFEANLFGLAPDNYLEYPIVIQLIEKNTPSTGMHLVVFDVRFHTYYLLYCTSFKEFSLYFNLSYLHRFSPRTNLLELMVIENILFQSNQLEDMADILRLNFSTQS
ncbi:MAG: arginine-tRNA-protein transferase [Saprospiraceae bacterium]